MINISFPNKVSTATDRDGRRYGDYFWFSFSIGRMRVCVFPGHVRCITFAPKKYYIKLKQYRKQFKVKRKIIFINQKPWLR